MNMFQETTLAEARVELQSKLDKGTVCPCCDRHTQVYHRKITSAMAYGLILLYRATRLGFSELEIDKDLNMFFGIHIEEYFKSLKIPSSIRGDVPKLRYWELITPRMETSKSKDGNPNSGYYSITPKGTAFVTGNLLLPSHIKVYNNKMVGLSEKSKNISIQQALGSKFNYNELMGG
jgi:hypothetical protein